MRGQSSGGHDDRQGHAGATQHFDQFNPGQAGYFVLGDQQMVAVGLKRLPGRGAIVGSVNVVAGTRQRLRVELAKVAVFFNHENAMGGPRLALPYWASWLSLCWRFVFLKLTI